MTQVVEFNNRSAFPIVADPKTTSKPKSVKMGSYNSSFNINHNYAAATSFSTQSVGKFMKKEVKEKITTKVIAKFGAKAIPIFGNALWAIDFYCTFQSLAGYSYEITDITAKAIKA